MLRNRTVRGAAARDRRIMMKRPLDVEFQVGIAAAEGGPFGQVAGIVMSESVEISGMRSCLPWQTETDGNA